MVTASLPPRSDVTARVKAVSPGHTGVDSEIGGLMSINRALQSPVCPSPVWRPILGNIQTPSSQQSTVSISTV
ncbi:hypothetical protein RE2895_52740 [Rhodococcus erythropolis]|nr:hypothetical protein RE2895_52740 [Rhodococcus erythropolis]